MMIPYKMGVGMKANMEKMTSEKPTAIDLSLFSTDLDEVKMNNTMLETLVDCITFELKENEIFST
jgi:hypothetical protein